LLNESC